MRDERAERPRVLLVNRCIVLNDEGKILLIKRSKRTETYNASLWEAPGGKLDDGQDISNALEREVLEETGLFVIPTTRIAFYHSEVLHEGKYQGLPYVVLIGIGKLIGGKLQLSEEHDEALWVNPGEAFDMAITPETRKALATLMPQIKAATGLY